MSQEAIKQKYTRADVSILNILRCEPPSFAFNFLEYAGLPRSVFRLLKSIDDEDYGTLDDIVSEGNCRTREIPSSSSSTLRPHTLFYEKNDTMELIIVNAYNKFSDKSDSKFFANAHIKGTDGKDYDATFIALEVYREKGNMHPVWQLGVFVTNPHDSNHLSEALYEESLIVDLSQSEERLKLYASITKFILTALATQAHNPDWQGINQDPNHFNYLQNITGETAGIDVVDEETFRKNVAKWYRYLVGTMDINNILKFEDRYAGNNPFNYRVELVGTHLTDSGSGKYLIELMEDCRDDAEPTRELGPFSHAQAVSQFVQSGNHYLDRLYQNAGKGKRQFEIAMNWQRIDFRYATIVSDVSGEPITVSSWSTPYGLDGEKLSNGQRHHYLQLWGSSPEPLRLDEGKHFPQGIHPRNFMGQLTNMIGSIEYNDGKNLLELGPDKGIPLMNPD